MLGHNSEQSLIITRILALSIGFTESTRLTFVSFFSSVDFPFINSTHVAIVRMKSEMYFGPTAKYVKMLVLVLSPLNEVGGCRRLFESFESCKL